MSKIDNYKNNTNLENNIIWDIKNALESEKLKMDDLVSQAMEDIKQYTKNETKEFINEMSKFEAFDSDVLRQTLRYDTFDIYRDFSVSFLTNDDLSKIYWDNFIWFKDFFSSGVWIHTNQKLKILQLERLIKVKKNCKKIF